MGVSATAFALVVQKNHIKIKQEKASGSCAGVGL
jgi:hypothetical protein